MRTALLDQTIAEQIADDYETMPDAGILRALDRRTRFVRRAGVVIVTFPDGSTLTDYGDDSAAVIGYPDSVEH